jgi:hypothetical protein
MLAVYLLALTWARYWLPMAALMRLSMCSSTP